MADDLNPRGRVITDQTLRQAGVLSGVDVLHARLEFLYFSAVRPFQMVGYVLRILGLPEETTSVAERAENCEVWMNIHDVREVGALAFGLVIATRMRTLHSLVPRLSRIRSQVVSCPPVLIMLHKICKDSRTLIL